MRYGSSYTEIRTLPIDLEQSAMPHLAQAGHLLARPKASSTRLRMRCETA